MIGATPNNGTVGTFLVSAGWVDKSGNDLSVIRVDNPLTKPTFTGTTIKLGKIDSANGGPMPDAPQLGSTNGITTNDGGANNAVWRNNALWLTSTINPTSTYDPANAGQATAHWYKINTTTLTSLTLSGQGDIGAEDLGAATATYYPSIAADALGNAIVGFSASNAGIYVGAYYAEVNSAGVLQSTGTLDSGQDAYYRTFGAGENRWGDFSGVAIDPQDDSFWVYNQYALPQGSASSTYPSDTGRWGTHVGNVTIAARNGATAPASPGRLGAALANPGEIDLNWTDYAANETGFSIQRAAVDSTGQVGAFSQVGSVGANVTTFRDTTQGTATGGSLTFAYRVLAYNAYGNSAPSNQPQITLSAPVISSVSISPSTAYTNDLLTAMVTASDSDNDPLTGAYQWFKNNVAISGATGKTLNLSVAGGDDARAVGADEDRRRAVLQKRLHLHHVKHRDAFGNGADDLQAGIRRFHDSIRGERRGDEDHRGRRAGRVHRLAHGVEDRQPVGVFRGALARRHAAHHLRPVLKASLRVKRPGRAGNPLANHFRVAVDQNAHRPRKVRRRQGRSKRDEGSAE
jgi:hypothetical protein